MVTSKLGSGGRRELLNVHPGAGARLPACRSVFGRPRWHEVDEGAAWVTEKCLIGAGCGAPRLEKVAGFEKAAGLEKARGGWRMLEKASSAVDASSGARGSSRQSASQAARPRHSGQQHSRS
jgi:hypothetical protein